MKWPFGKAERVEIRNWAPSPEVRTSFHDGGVAFLHSGSGKVLTANRVGARIWKGLTAGKDLDRIASAIGREFDAPESLVRSDAELFVSELSVAGLLIHDGDRIGAAR